MCVSVSLLQNSRITWRTRFVNPSIVGFLMGGGKEGQYKRVVQNVKATPFGGGMVVVRLSLCVEVLANGSCRLKEKLPRKSNNG